MKNWYKKIKLSQTIMDSQSSGQNINEEGDKVVNGPQRAPTPYQKGMKIRDRRKGVALPQEYGIIKKIDDKEMEVEWFNSKDNSIKKDVFNLDDTVSLSSVIAEI